MLLKFPIALGDNGCPIVLRVGATNVVQMSHCARNQWLSYCAGRQRC